MKEQVLKSLLNKYPVGNNPQIRSRLLDEASAYEKDTYRQIHMDNPFAQNEQKLRIAQRSFDAEEFGVDNLESDALGYYELGELSNRDVNIGFWMNNISRLRRKASKRSDIRISRELLLNKWGKAMFSEYSKWELAEIEKYRKRLIKTLGGWLKVLQQFKDIMDDLSIDEKGLLFDLGKGKITVTDIEQLKKWAEYISEKDSVRELCDMLGRLRLIEHKTKTEMVQTTLRYENIVMDINSKEEIVGIKTGNELENLLPQELILLIDSDTSLIFDKKFAESQLLCFDLAGFSRESMERTVYEMQNVAEEEAMGPIIICVDTSSSMTGTPENIAKAVTLCMAARAREQRRNCFLINFSTDIETMDLSDAMGIKELVDFLGRSFYGGTDAAPAIEYAVNKFGEEAYQKADLLVISDFIMNSLPEELMEKARTVKKEGNRFYSLSICSSSSNEQLGEIFDGEWIYNAELGDIFELKRIVDGIDLTKQDIKKEAS